MKNYWLLLLLISTFKSITLNNCKNCSKEISGKFCSNCGFSDNLKRIDKQYIFEEIVSVLNFDKGIFYTVKELLIRPGNTIREFILENRKRLVKPIFFIIICSLAYSIAQQILGFEAGYIQFDVDNLNAPFIVKMYEWLTTNFGYMNILLAIPITLWIRLFFRKYSYNTYEIFILLCYTMGVSMLINTLLGMIESIFNFNVLNFGFVFDFLYSTWAIGQFYGRGRKMNYFKASLSYVLGFFSSVIIFIIIGMILQELIS